MPHSKKHIANSTASPGGGNTEEKGDSIEIRAGEVQEILGGVPTKLVRFGIYIFLLVLFLIIVFAFIFRYPDVLKSELVVTTENPPAILEARATGRIVDLKVNDNQKVQANEVIALIENTAEYADVITLKNYIDSVQPDFDTLHFTNVVRFPKNLKLGPVQEFYSAFLTKYDELIEFNQRQYYQLKNSSLENQIYNSKLLYERIFEQKQSADEEYGIKKRYYELQLELLAKEAITIVEVDKAKSAMLEKKIELDGLRSRLVVELNNREIMEQQKINNIREYEDLKLKFESAVLEAFNNLKSEIRNWELTFLMQSPISGTITFNKFYSENQNVTEGDKVFTVVPDNIGEIVGKVELPIRGSGKVEIGQRVNAKFDNYPYMEYGMVTGKVKNISLVPDDNFYMVGLEFPGGLVTNYNDTLRMQNQLKGQAEIITEDLRLIQRIFNPLKALWKERVKQ